MTDNRLPDDISFERWVQHVFDHPVPPQVADDVWEAYQNELDVAFEKVRRGEMPLADIPPQPDWIQWHFRRDAEDWDPQAQPARTVRYITQLFQSIDVLTTPYSDEQINQGINYLIYSACSSHMYALRDGRILLTSRIACVESFYDVYTRLYARKCTPDLGHLNTDGHIGNPLNHMCYMWWDIIPVYGKSGEPAREALDQAMLDVMAKTLEIDHEACQEGALHGLGHWRDAYGEFVQETIDSFLARNPNVSPSLRSYAQAARNTGIVWENRALAESSQHAVPVEG